MNSLIQRMLRSQKNYLRSYFMKKKHKKRKSKKTEEWLWQVLINTAKMM